MIRATTFIIYVNDVYFNFVFLNSKIQKAHVHVFDKRYRNQYRKNIQGKVILIK